MKLKITILFLFLSFLVSAQTKKKFKLPDALNEASGIIYSSPDSIWWVNDGGNSPTLFLSDLNKNILKKIEIPNTKNRDWEDLTSDNQGNIYIGDFGNNANKRQDLLIYIYNLSTTKLDSITYNLPDQKEFPPARNERNFDMEAFFWKEGKLHLFSKNRLGTNQYTTKHYSLEAEKGQQVAILHQDIFLKKRVVTSAAISADGKKVVLMSYYYKKWLGFFPVSHASIFVFTDFENEDFFSGKMKERKIPVILFPTQYENIDFVNKNKVIIGSERTAFIRARGKIIRL